MKTIVTIIGFIFVSSIAMAGDWNCEISNGSLNLDSRNISAKSGELTRVFERKGVAFVLEEKDKAASLSAYKTISATNGFNTLTQYAGGSSGPLNVVQTTSLDNYEVRCIRMEAPNAREVNAYSGIIGKLNAESRIPSNNRIRAIVYNGGTTEGSALFFVQLQDKNSMKCSQEEVSVFHYDSPFSGEDKVDVNLYKNSAPTACLGDWTK